MFVNLKNKENILISLFKNAKVLDLTCEKGYKNGCVVVEDDTITYVGDLEPEIQADKIIDVKSNLLMPGFVNTHAHTAMTILRGIKDDASLQEWLFDNVIPREGKLTDDDVYWGQMLGIAEYVRGGITAMEENYFNYDGMTKAIAKSGIRARVSVGAKVSTPKEYNCYEDLKSQYLIIKANTNSKLVSVSCFAHAIYSTDENKFFDILKFAKDNNLCLGIHLSETLKEVGDCTVEHNGLTPAGYLESLGYLFRPCLCAHCVHMDKDDLQILADNDASVSTCPSSNIKLASGIAPIYAMLNKGINVTIGTDGVASNNSLDMFKEMFLVATLSKVSLYDPAVVSAKDVLKMATINGAKAMGLNSGEIKVGKNADIILVNLTEPHMQPQSNLISNLVYSAKSSDVYLTMVGGKVLYNNGEYNIGENIETIYENVNKIRERIE